MRHPSLFLKHKPKKRTRYCGHDRAYYRFVSCDRRAFKPRYPFAVAYLLTHHIFHINGKLLNAERKLTYYLYLLLLTAYSVIQLGNTVIVVVELQKNFLIRFFRIQLILYRFLSCFSAAPSERKLRQKAFKRPLALNAFTPCQIRIRSRIR